MQYRPTLLPRLFRSKRQAIPREVRNPPEYRSYRRPPHTTGKGPSAAVALFAVLGLGILVVWVLDWRQNMVLLAVPNLYIIIIDGTIGLMALLAIPAKRWSLPVRLEQLLLDASAVAAGGLLAILLVGLYARHGASPGHTYRVRVVYLNKKTGFEAEDRTLASAIGRNLSREGSCFVVRKYETSFGFTWLELLDASPLPKFSHVGWPISREDCFSDKPLAELAQ